MGVNEVCRTAEVPLPGSRITKEEEAATPAANNVYRAAEGRHGELTDKIALENEYDKSLVCECEGVSIGEVNYALNELDANDLVALRRRTRIGMGTCQGELCACRAAGLLSEAHNCTAKAKQDLIDFLNERWKGMSPVAWGESLRESQFSAWLYGGVCNLNSGESKKEVKQ